MTAANLIHSAVHQSLVSSALSFSAHHLVALPEAIRLLARTRTGAWLFVSTDERDAAEIRNMGVRSLGPQELKAVCVGVWNDRFDGWDLEQALRNAFAFGQPIDESVTLQEINADEVPKHFLMQQVFERLGIEILDATWVAEESTSEALRALRERTLAFSTAA